MTRQQLLQLNLKLEKRLFSALAVYAVLIAAAAFVCIIIKSHDASCQLVASSTNMQFCVNTDARKSPAALAQLFTTVVQEAAAAVESIPATEVFFTTSRAQYFDTERRGLSKALIHLRMEAADEEDEDNMHEYALLSMSASLCHRDDAKSALSLHVGTAAMEESHSIVVEVDGKTRQFAQHVTVLSKRKLKTFGDVTLLFPGLRDLPVNLSEPLEALRGGPVEIITVENATISAPHRNAARVSLQMFLLDGEVQAAMLSANLVGKQASKIESFARVLSLELGRAGRKHGLFPRGDSSCIKPVDWVCETPS